MKILVKFWISIVTTIICLNLFVGCSTKELIPNGNYVLHSTSENEYFYVEPQNVNEYYWEIKGNVAQRWVSGYIDYKGKIKSQDDKFIFVGYTWKELFSSIEKGSTAKYAVTYNENLKSIILTAII